MKKISIVQAFGSEIFKEQKLTIGVDLGDRCSFLPANGGVVSEFSRLEVTCPSVRPIERAMREPRMDPQSTVFPAQPCRP